MIKHEGNDPRQRGRDAAEKARLNRVAMRLVFAIVVLSGAVATMMLVRGWSFFG